MLFHAMFYGVNRANGSEGWFVVSREAESEDQLRRAIWQSFDCVSSINIATSADGVKAFNGRLN